MARRPAVVVSVGVLVPGAALLRGVVHHLRGSFRVAASRSVGPEGGWHWILITRASVRRLQRSLLKPSAAARPLQSQSWHEFVRMREGKSEEDCKRELVFPSQHAQLHAGLRCFRRSTWQRLREARSRLRRDRVKVTPGAMHAMSKRSRSSGDLRLLTLAAALASSSSLCCCGM